MELPPSTFTPRLSTSTLQFINCAFDHGPIGKERSHEPLDLAGQMKKGLSKPTHLLSVCFHLYAHCLITYSFKNKSQDKNETSEIFFHEEWKGNLLGAQLTTYSRLTRSRRNPSRWNSLLSESQEYTLKFHHKDDRRDEGR